jgi:hypothetical protein
MAEWPKGQFQIGLMFRGSAGTRRKSVNTNIFDVLCYRVSSKEPQIINYKHRPEVWDHGRVAERPIPNWADVPRKCWHQTKVCEHKHFWHTMLPGKLKRTPNLYFKNRLEARDHALVAERPIPNWADVPRKCWYQTKVWEHNILEVLCYCVISKEPQI